MIPKCFKLDISGRDVLKSLNFDPIFEIINMVL